MNLSKTLLALLSVAVIAALAPSANAATLYVHGASCWSPSTYLTLDHWGAASWDPSSPMTIYCPVPAASQSTSISFAMNAYDRNASTDVSCSLEATDPSGTTLSTVTATTSGSGSGAQTVSSSTAPVSAPLYLWFSCTLPPHDTLGPSALIDVMINY